MPAPDPVYDVVAAFAAGLVERGVTDVVISPGSRSTPLAVGLHAQPGLHTWIQLDERSAGFFALGQARRTGRPSVLVCTSGTAAANYLPAVVEAHHGGVPLVVATADRPPELRNWGAGQTIDQVGLYGTATRWAADLPVAGDWTPARARIAAHRAVVAATGHDPGPVHLNWPLREPLEPVGAVPVAEAALPAEGIGSTDGDRAAAVPDLPLGSRGVIVVGPDAAPGVGGQREVVDAALRLGAKTGWPVIGEPVAGTRRVPDTHGAVCVASAAHLLAIDRIAEELAPEIVVRVGNSPTTKPVRVWLERQHPAVVVLVDPAERWNDASFTVTHHLTGPAPAVLAALAARAGDPIPEWASRWAALDAAAQQAIDERVGADDLFSAAVARITADAVPAGALVMASNSMPVRDLDGFVAGAGPLVEFVGNRGASGIDGITSTALGLASRHEGPVVAFIGDLALLHDLAALAGAARAGLHLTVVCVDNDGGGIFSMLPIAARGPEVHFETLFRTPHSIDLAAIDGFGGVRVAEICGADDLRAALATAAASTEPGVDLLLVRVDRDADIAQRRTTAGAVSDAVERLVR